MTLQPQYSLLVREIEWEIVPAARRRARAAALEPARRGLPVGKYRRGGGRRATPGSATTPAAAWRPGSGADERTWEVIDAVQGVAEARRSMAEVALAWVTNRPGSPPRSWARARSTSCETNLRPPTCACEELAALDAASDLRASDYPYGELGIDQRDRTLGWSV